MASSNDGIIAATQRPDGTWRKERKVKAGYVPIDEAKKYENRMVKFFSEKPKYPPGYNPNAASPVTIPLTKNQKKNEKKKQKRLEKKNENTTEKPIKQEISKNLKQPVDSILRDTEKLDINDASELDDRIDKSKQIKSLKKKLKQIEQLEEKISNGETLEQLQLEKISKKSEFEEELNRLE